MSAAAESIDRALAEYRSATDDHARQAAYVRLVITVEKIRASSSIVLVRRSPDVQSGLVRESGGVQC